MAERATRSDGPARRRKRLILGAALVVAGAVVWCFPLFRIVPLASASTTATDAFDAAAAAGQFWSAKLLPATDRAVDIATLRAALARDPAAARQRYGRSLGLGGATLFLVRSSGRVAKVEDDGMTVALDEAGGNVVLSTGPIFGNAVRDVTGLIDVSAYANSQDFNALSTQLNQLVESRVIPELKSRATVGKPVRFVGCVELEGEAGTAPWSIVPLQVAWP